MNKIYSFILMFFLTITVSALSAQHRICLDFEDLQPGDRIGRASNLNSGDLFYTQEAIDIRLHDFLYPDGTRGFENVLILNKDHTTDPNIAGVKLFPSNINLGFDLTKLASEVNYACIDYVYWGGDINLSINGADTFILSSIEELLALEGKTLSPDPNTKIQINTHPNDQNRGTICINGISKSILIGGQELALDHFCVYLNEGSQACVINEIKAKITQCHPNGNFDIELGVDFEHQYRDAQFEVYVDGLSVGIFRSGSVPINLEDVPVFTDANTFEVQVCPSFSNSNTPPEACCLDLILQKEDCSTETLCSITEAKAYVARCYPDSVYFLGIQADWDLNNLDQYSIVEGDIIYPIVERGTEGSLIIGPFFFDDANREYELELIDLRIPNCTVPINIPMVDRCEEDEDVWPGDANVDNTANHLDLLSLGFAWGQRGPGRISIASTWSPIRATNWGLSIEPFNTDLKHADCNGDGVINERDIAVIRANYGRTSGSRRVLPELPNTNSAPPLFFDVSQVDNLPENGFFSIPIVLGSADIPLTDLYGVAFTVEFDPAVIDPDQIEIVYPNSWLGEPGVNMATIDYHFREDGKVDIALTRTDQKEVSGFGVVAYFRGIRDDIVGRHQTEMRVYQSFGIHGNQQMIQLNGLNTTAPLQTRQQAEKSYGLVDLKAGLLVYPNPSTETVYVEHRFGVPVDAVQILTTNGRTMTPRYQGANEVNISDLPKGLYIMRVEIGGYVIHQKLFKTDSR